MAHEKVHKAWRFLLNVDAPLYVESVRTPKLVDYSYTTDENNAMLLTEHQCKEFCAYMKECNTTGFWC